MWVQWELWLHERTLSSAVQMTCRHTSCDCRGPLVPSSHQGRTRPAQKALLGVRKLLSTASTLSTAQKQGLKEAAKQKPLLQPDPILVGWLSPQITGGELSPAAGSRGGVNSWRHTQIRGQKGKAGSTALHWALHPSCLWPRSRVRPGPQPGKVLNPEPRVYVNKHP